MKRIALLFVIAAFGISAAEADLTMPKRKNMYDYAGQGFANIILAPSHLLDSPYGLLESDGPTVAATKGVVQGISRMFMDMGVGIAELATAPFAPIINEEYKNPAYDTGLINTYPPADLYDNWY